MKNQKKPRDLPNIPYWPTQDFVTKAITKIRKQGMQGTDVELANLIHKAYWAKREKLLVRAQLSKV